jgi:hypothetical protein
LICTLPRDWHTVPAPLPLHYAPLAAPATGVAATATAAAAAASSGVMRLNLIRIVALPKSAVLDFHTDSSLAVTQDDVSRPAGKGFYPSTCNARSFAAQPEVVYNTAAISRSGHRYSGWYQRDRTISHELRDHGATPSPPKVDASDEDVVPVSRAPA